MGSLTSRPKVPDNQSQNIVYVPTPSVTTPAPESVVEASPEEISKTRVENVLRRSRSKLGTVFTSFRGILSDNGTIPQRKSLLGE